MELDDPEVRLAQDVSTAVVGEEVAGAHDTPVRAHVGGRVLVHGQFDGVQAVRARALAHEGGALIGFEQILFELPAAPIVRLPALNDLPRRGRRRRRELLHVECGSEWPAA